MLFVALFKVRAGTTQERTARRLEWSPPEGGAEVVAEYWLQTPDPAVIAIGKADHIGQIWASFAGWDDMFEITVFPAVEAAEGIELAKQMAQG